MRTLFSSFILLLSALAVCAAPIGFNEPTIPGLVGWWTFNEGTGTIFTADKSGLANTGFLSNAPAWTTGVIGYGLNFGVGAVTNYVRTTFTNSLAQAFSFGAWANTRINGTANARGIGSKPVNSNSGAAAPYVSFGLGLDNNLKFQLSVGSGTTFTQLSSTNAYTSNVWYHVVGTFDGATLRLYVNASQAASQAYSSTIRWDDEPLACGTYLPDALHSPSPGLTQWQGLIDDVRIYNRALTAAEVRQLYNGGAGSQH